MHYAFDFHQIDLPSHLERYSSHELKRNSKEVTNYSKPTICKVFIFEGFYTYKNRFTNIYSDSQTPPLFTQYRQNDPRSKIY